MKKVCLFLTLLLGLHCLMAAPVNSNTAAMVAGNFWKSLSPKAADLELVSDGDFAHLFIFQVNGNEGFVIVAGDDRAYPILGFGDDGTGGDLDPETRFWLCQYEREIEAIASGTVRNDDAALADYIAREWARLLDGGWLQPKSGNMVPAMLTTRWNQSPYYNYYCPQGCPAGCVATAVAQVMKYWNHPVKGTGSHSYNTQYGMLSANFDSTYYDWDHMPNSLSSSSSMTEVHAVAELSYHVGVAAEMSYETDGSGASLVGGWYGPSAQSALKEYFGYRPSIYGAYKSEYTDAEWIQLLKDELDAGRPVLYAGYDSYGGHAFVFDGYNSSSHFHVNWGWGGSYNGYFVMGALNPGGGGVGSNTSNTFNSSNQILVGVQPLPRLGIAPAALTFPTEGGSQTVAITNNYGDTTSMVITSSESWLYANPVMASGSGSGTTINGTVSTLANTTGAAREGNIILEQGSNRVIVPVRQFACSNSDMCTLVINGYDSRGNGWSGGTLTLESTNGVMYGEMSICDGSYAIQEFAVCPDTVLAIWRSGSADSECGFVVENGDGVVWVNHTAGTVLGNGDTFLIANPCQNSDGLDPVTYSITAMANDTVRGYVEGGGEGLAFGESTTLTARANTGYRFERWADGGTTNPRTLTVLENKNYTARFQNLGTDTLHYDNGSYNLSYGGEEETHWAIRFDPSDLVGHVTLESVKFYNVRQDYYTLSIHQGETPRLTNRVASMTFYQGRQTRYRWVEKTLDSAVVLDHSKPLWVVLSYTTDGAPAAASTWCGNDDGSWVSTNGIWWHSLADYGINATWLIRAHMPVDRNEYTLTVSTNNKKWGTATGGGVYRYGQAATLTATPKEGYHFVKWSDENTENPRTYYVKGDKMLRAIFAEGEAGIEDVAEADVVLYMEGHRLFVRGVDGRKVNVYDALGRSVYQAENYHDIAISLPAAGVYVVQIDNRTMRKVVALGK